MLRNQLNNNVLSAYLSRRDVYLFSITLIGVLVSRGMSLLGGLAIDDYLWTQINFVNHNSEELLRQMRPIMYIYVRILNVLRLTAPDLNILVGLLNLFAQAALSTVLFKFFGLSKYQYSEFTIFFVCIHPYNSEILTFKATAFQNLTWIVSFIIGLQLLQSQHKHIIVLGVMAWIVGISTYQLIVNYIVAALVVLVLLFVITPENSFLKKQINKFSIYAIVSVGIGIALNIIILSASGISASSRADPIAVGKLTNRGIEILKTI